MFLSGTVDAAVNGGLKNYSQMISTQFLPNRPDIAEDIAANPHKASVFPRLKRAFRDHLTLLERVIELHGQKCQKDMMPLHNHIETCFIALEDEILTALSC